MNTHAFSTHPCCRYIPLYAYVLYSKQCDVASLGVAPVKISLTHFQPRKSLLVWVSQTSVKAHVGNALLFASFHLKSLMYSSCACAISAALLKCIGLQAAPLSFGAIIACTCLILLQLVLQPVPLGGLWAVCAAGFLFFTIGTQQLIAALAEGALPKGFFAFAGYSHLWWLSPLIAAAVLAAVLLLCHYLELLLAVSRGGYHIFCPPNPHLYSLDDLARDAAQGRPLSLSPSKPRSPPSVAAFAQLFREKLSPRLQGPAMAQQRRTVGGPASAATRPAATDQEALVTERKFNAEPSQQTKASSEGAWLVALWLRGSFFLASLGALCIALSLGLCAMVSDSGAAFHGSRGPAAFDEISNLLLATQRQPMQQVEVSFVTVQQQKPLLGGGAQLARNFLQQQEDALFLENQRLRWQQRSSHLSHVLQAPAENSTGDAFHISSMVDHGAEAISGNSFLHLRRHDGPQKDKAHHQHGMKSAAALLLLALVLLTPIIGTSLAEWIEGGPQRQRRVPDDGSLAFRLANRRYLRVDAFLGEVITRNPPSVLFVRFRYLLCAHGADKEKPLYDRTTTNASHPPTNPCTRTSQANRSSTALRG